MERREMAEGRDHQLASMIGEAVVVDLTNELFHTTRSTLLKVCMLGNVFHITLENGMWTPLNRSLIMKYGLSGKLESI
jgi:hypothetical protein